MGIRIRSVAVLFALCAASTVLAQPSPSPWESEVVYQIFQRSFYDSNGDGNGDFKGIEEKLGYVSRLGATAILLQPILKSRLYHNYFPDSFLEADPKFGTNDEFFDMVRAAHRHHLKVILDMEQQYVASLHPWYIAATTKPDSPEAKNVFIRSGYFHFNGLPTYDGQTIPIATIDTNQPEVLDGLVQTFKYWAGPPGRTRDGVDGFRIDHMMDDLDNKHSNTNMLTRVWKPIEDAVRKIKPDTFFLAEQSDWGLGIDQFLKSDVDGVYAIPLRFAFAALDADKIRKELRAELAATPPGKTQFVFVEDHDVQRYASLVKSDPGLLRIGAVLALTIKGTPSIYYGQELGMKGTQLKGHTDGNDIPVRLAFRWSKEIDATGMAQWYGSGPWTDPAFSASNDGVSVEEEEGSPDSLLNFYRKLIALRKHDPALRNGTEEVGEASSPNVLTFTRRSARESVLVAINFGDQVAIFTVPTKGRDLWNGEAVPGQVSIAPHGFRIVKLAD